MNYSECESLGIKIEWKHGHSIRPHLKHVFIELESGIYDADVAGKHVVDVGAFLGETSIYFSKRGAKKVFSYEPFISGQMIPHNAQLSGCTNIQYISEAVGGKDEVLQIDPLYINNGCTRLSYATKSESTLQQTSLNTLTDKYEITDGILKIDAEGSEFPIIGYASIETLQRYTTILMEVHTYLGNTGLMLVKLQNAGFEVMEAANPSTASFKESICFWVAKRT